MEDPRNPTDSPFEDEFLTFVKKYGLPSHRPTSGSWTEGRRLLSEAHRIVELDGGDFHDDQDAFRDDRERDTENLKHGLTTMRLTRDRLKLTPGYEAERLMEIYSRRVG